MYTGTSDPEHIYGEGGHIEYNFAKNGIGKTMRFMLTKIDIFFNSPDSTGGGHGPLVPLRSMPECM